MAFTSRNDVFWAPPINGGSPNHTVVEYREDGDADGKWVEGFVGLIRLSLEQNAEKN